MYIEKLTVQNFRCFDRKEITFAPGFNVLIGDNGSGKTAILDAIKVGLAQFLDLTQQIDPFPDYPLGNEKTFGVRIMTAGTSEQPTLEYVYPISVTLQLMLEGQRCPVHLWAQPRDKITTKREAAEIVNRWLKEISTQTPPVLPALAYFTSRRHGQSWSDSRSAFDENVLLQEVVGPTSRLNSYATALAAESNERKVKQWIMRFDVAAKQREEINRTMQAVKQAILGCLGGFNAFWFDALEWSLVVRQTNGAVLLTETLSDGQRNILSLVADIAYRCATLNPELRENATKETPGVVLIDELDLHLHPNWQRRIVSDLRRTFPRIQFIVTTHSPIILQNLDPEKDQVIDLSGGEFPLTARSSPEDILKRMGVEIPQQSWDWLQLFQTAQRYYDLLDEAKALGGANGHARELDRLRKELDALSIPFEENPAWAALLARKRAAAGIDPETEE